MQVQIDDARVGFLMRLGSVVLLDKDIVDAHTACKAWLRRYMY
jgi:hypothetical protein